MVVCYIKQKHGNKNTASKEDLKETKPKQNTKQSKRQGYLQLQLVLCLPVKELARLHCHKGFAILSFQKEPRGQGLGLRYVITLIMVIAFVQN